MTDHNEMITRLAKTFEDFKDAHAEQLAGVKAKFEDVVTTDKLNRVNSALGEVQAQLDALALKAAGSELKTGGRVVDAEYTKAFTTHIKRGDVQANLQKGADAEGGYLAPREWDRTITDALIEVSPMRSLCSVQTIAGVGMRKLINLRGTASGWVGETASRTETATATFAPYDYTTGEIYANPAATQQMLDDAEVNLEAWLASEVQTEFAYQEGLAFVSGNGSNRPKGILTFVTGAANAAAHPLGAIALTNSGAAADITADGLVNLVHSRPTERMGNSRFVMNRGTMNAIRLLKDGQNNYLWSPSYQAGVPSTLLGYAITEIAAMPAIGASAVPVLFGDFARTYLILDRVGTRILRDPFTNKPFVMFYTTKRVGGDILDPTWMSGLTIAA